MHSFLSFILHQFLEIQKEHSFYRKNRQGYLVLENSGKVQKTCFIFVKLAHPFLYLDQWHGQWVSDW